MATSVTTTHYHVEIEPTAQPIDNVQCLRL
jgi:hypothetical protein